MEAKLCFIGHALMENRHGLFVDAQLTKVSGHAERPAALDMIEAYADRPGAYIVFGKNSRGEFAFGAIEATLELEYAPRIVFFNWTAFDEGDEVSGSGSAELTEDDDTILEIELSFHNGDNAVLKARRFQLFSTAC